MGVVYKARDPQLDRLVAIKMILGVDPSLLKRFEVEARSTASLQHPNIVTIYDFGDQDGSPYLVMEYLEGTSLESVISSGQPLSLTSKLSICVDICGGLQYAHERGIIHRDVKPANVMLLSDGSVKIVDFGIARIGDTGISRTEVIGSLHYMSPEQFQSQPLDSRTDIFSTGVVLYRLLTGALPFQAPAEAAVIYQIIHEAPPPVSACAEGCPQELDLIVSKALAKNRDDRYLSSRDLAFDLLVVRDQQKHQEVGEWLQRAETALQRTEWTKAEECLRQLLKIEKNHTHAHQMLGEVQERARQQRRAEQVRLLRIQADEALLDRRYDEALRILDQAIGLDSNNKELSNFRESIQESKSRAARLRVALRRAEGAHQSGDLDEAKRAVSEALELDPQETSAKALQLVIFKQAEERDRQQELRKLLDQANHRLANREMTQVFEILKSAEGLDPGSLELQSLLKRAQSVQEEEIRKAGLARLVRQIEEALIREDYASASSQAEEGLQKYPRQEGLLKLKTIADTERKRLEEKAYVRSQFTAANTLLDSGKTFEALSILDRALQRVPGESQLESLRSIIKERLTQEESEDHLRRSLDQARQAVAAGDFDEAVRTLERAKQEFPDSHDVDELLHKAETFRVHERSVQHTLASAQKLLEDKEPQSAVQLLEEALQEQSDGRIAGLLADARRQLDQFQRGLESTISEGERILHQHGAAEAASFLQAQPHQYSVTPRFQGLVDRVHKRGAAEALDQQLAREPRPEAQVRFAEAALRKSPGNEEIEKTLASARERKTRISSVVERARELEASLRYEEAAEELAYLRKLYSEYPRLEAEILRLTKLDEQRKLLLNRPSNFAPENPPQAILLDQSDASATNIVGSVGLAREAFDPVPLRDVSTVHATGGVASGAIAGREREVVGQSVGPSPRKIPFLLLGAAVVAVVIVGAAFLHFRHPAIGTVSNPSRGASDKSVPGSNPKPIVAPKPDVATEGSSKPHPAGDAVMAAEREKLPSNAAPKASGSEKVKPQPLDTSHVPPAPAAAGSSSSANAEKASTGSPTATADKSASKDSSGMQATSTIATNQPPAGLPPQPHTDGGASSSVRPPEPVVPTPQPVAPSISDPSPESTAVRNALRSYEDAYASMDVGELQKIWPSLSKDQLKKLKEGFRGAQAVKVTLQDCGAPTLSEATAQVQCSQSMVYTRDGKRQSPLTKSVAILLRKAANGNWLVDKVQ